MATASIKNEIITHVERLPSSLQRKVLEFTRTLERGRLKGIQGKSLLVFAGTIPSEDLEKMPKRLRRNASRLTKMSGRVLLATDISMRSQVLK